MSKTQNAGQKYVNEHYNIANMAAAFNRGAYIEHLANEERFKWLPEDTFEEWYINCPTIELESRETLHLCFLAGVDSEAEQDE